MSTYLTQGIVLKRNYIRDYDREYVIYTRDVGKIRAIVKGANKVVSKLRSHLEPFLVTDLMIANGRGMARVAAAKCACSYNSIGHDLSKVVMASYFFEVTDAIIIEALSDRMIFKIVEGFLVELDQAKDSQDSLLVLNKSLFDLLSQLGHCPIALAKSQRQLTHDIHQLILEVGEKEIKSFDLLKKILCQKN